MTVYAQGVDFANQRPEGSALVKAGKEFVVRYLSPNTTGNPRKLLTLVEVNEYQANDLSICVVWETGTSRARAGYAAGRTDAQLAHAQLIKLGGPSSLPIYFAIDEDTTGPLVEPYFQGVADEIGLARTGAYGGIRPISYLFDHGRISYGWQTYAWSGGKWDARAQAQQYDNGESIPGAGSGYDLDRAMVANYGQWNPDGSIGDTQIMTEVDLTPAAIEAVRSAVWGKKLGTPGSVDETPGGMLSDLRGSILPGGLVANQLAAITALSAKLDGLPAAVVAALPPIVGGQPGFTDAQLAQIEAAAQAALGHLGLVVAA